MIPAAEAVPGRIVERPIERGRGRWGMALFIATEAMLFAMLLFGYFYLGASSRQWPPTEDPAYMLALVLLVILIVSSFTAAWAERGIRHDNVTRLRIGLAVTLLLAIAFLGIQILEYRIHLASLTPDEGAYGSIFYTITTLHMAHVILGLLMLAFVFARALAGHFSAHRHVAVSNAVLYWHFVDVVWIFIVVILYLSPHFYGP